MEYGLLIAGIAAVIAASIFAFGGGVDRLFKDSCGTIVEGQSLGTCD